MNESGSILGLLSQGGPVMYILLALSVFGLGIVLAKFLQFRRLRLRDTAYIEDVLRDIMNGALPSAQSRLAQTPNPAARVLEASLDACATSGFSEEDIKTEVVRRGSAVMQDLEHWLKALSSIGQLSPLLGLLGTVLGMIQAFMKIESATTSVNPALLAGGIWEALLTTAVGLAIAIPAMAAHYYFDGEIERVRRVMKDAATRALLLLKRSSGLDSSAEERTAQYGF